MRALTPSATLLTHFTTVDLVAKAWLEALHDPLAGRTGGEGTSCPSPFPKNFNPALSAFQALGFGPSSPRPRLSLPTNFHTPRAKLLTAALTNFALTGHL